MKLTNEARQAAKDVLDSARRSYWLSLAVEIQKAANKSRKPLRAPDAAGYWWAKSTDPERGWQMFVVDVNQKNKKLVVRLADALHTEFAKSPKSIEPWFYPNKNWKDWTEVNEP